MNLFDKLVTEAIKNQPTLAPLRVVVEKELLHHDILRVLSENEILPSLTFIGGTCLRTCYGGIRLSEDLDFTGGKDFTRENLSDLGKILIKNLQEKYSLLISVNEPTRDKQNVDTWKIKVETRPESKDYPAQRINIDICAIPSYESIPILLINPYGVDMGTSGLIIQAESREEIFADKLLAFAFRPNRIKYRDLWDISWLHGQGIKPRYSLIPNKLADRNISMQTFLEVYKDRNIQLSTSQKYALEFNNEMRRFLPAAQLKAAQQDQFWKFILYLINEIYNEIKNI